MLRIAPDSQTGDQNISVARSQQEDAMRGLDLRHFLIKCGLDYKHGDARSPDLLDEDDLAADLLDPARRVTIEVSLFSLSLNLSAEEQLSGHGGRGQTATRSPSRSWAAYARPQPVPCRCTRPNSRPRTGWSLLRRQEARAKKHLTQLTGTSASSIKNMRMQMPDVYVV